MNEPIVIQEFERYERVRRLGLVNMWDVKTVGQLTGLSRPRIIAIMKDYARLRDLFYERERGEANNATS